MENPRRFNKPDQELREKIVCLLLANPLHQPSCQCLKSEKRLAYTRPLDYSTIGLAEHLITYINTGIDDANDYEAVLYGEAIP